VSQRLDALAWQIGAAGIDVVCLQELFVLQAGPLAHAEHFIRFAEQMRALGLIHTVDPLAGMRPLLQNSGLAIFSRFPIERSSHDAFPSSAEPVNAKGIMTATIRVGAASWHIVNTHLDSRNASTQWQQASAVAAAVADLCAGPDDPLLAMGDYNIHSSPPSALYRHLADSMGISGASQDLFPGPHSNYPTCGSGFIDHAFASEAAVARLQRRAVVEWFVDGSGTSWEGRASGMPFDVAFCASGGAASSTSGNTDGEEGAPLLESRGAGSAPSSSSSSSPSSSSAMCARSPGPASVSDHRGLLMVFAAS
jgi:endonuclease/exonuclease/phosphatase family metal-dependent hydrolase